MMKTISNIIIVLCFLLIGCGNIIKPKSPQAEMLTALEKEYSLRRESISGWPSRTDCDSMLWAGIGKAGGIRGINLNDARDKNGKLFRRPSKDCYAKGQSRSDFSNDMLVGYLLSASHSDIHLYLNYLKSNRYNMGEGDPGATLVKPNVLGVMGRILGKDLAPRLPYAPNDKDYVRHIQMLMIYIDGRSTGFITNSELRHLKKYTRSNSDYLLYAIISKYDTDYTKDAIDLLLAKNVKYPTYVRGDSLERYRLAHWLFAASIILGE